MHPHLTRRNFLARAAGLGGLAAFENSRIARAMPAAATELGKVKIRGVQTATIMMRYPAHLVRVTTDTGLYGIGEAFNGPGIVDQIPALERYVAGQDPLQVEYLWARMVEGTSGHGSYAGTTVSAIAGIETALWDLCGKILNVPVYTLLGGRYRDRLLVYHDTGSPKTADPGPWVEEALRSKEYGFTAMKFDLDWEGRGQALTGGEPFRFRREIWNRSITAEEQRQWVRILEEVLKALGPGYDVGVDCHWNYNTRDSLRFAQAVEPLNLWFLEDPIPTDNADAMARITRATKTPICTGENLYGRHTFRPFIEKQAVDMIQPDPQKSGGLLETKKIADLADLYYITFACHNMCTPVGTYASAHVCAAVRNFVALESDSIEIPWWKDMVVNGGGKFYPGGQLRLPDGPGLGIELNEDVCKAHLAAGSRWFS